MASGQPYLQSDGDAFLFDRLSADPFLKQYCPGGVTGEKPPENATSLTIVRFWRQSPGTDKPRQDGEQGRVLSTPTYVVVALDRQPDGSDKVYGTVGGPLGQPYLQLAQRRIYSLLHGRTFQHGGFEFECACFADYSVAEVLKQNTRDVQVGWWIRMNVQ